MTAGICGTYQGQKAVLTCGHGNEQVGFLFTRYPYIKYSGSRIGQVSFQRANTSRLYGQQGVGSLGDFAIVTLNSNITTSNKIYGNLEITGTYSSVPQGTTIYKYGTTTGMSYGTVSRSGTGVIIQYGDGFGNVYYVEGLYTSSMRNSSGTDAIAPGDSGGPVYVKSGSKYLLHGIVTARKEPAENEVASLMYSSPIYFAQDVGFTVKTS